MGEIRTTRIAAASVTMLLCSAYNAVFNIISRALHLITFVTSAATMQNDYSEPSTWKEIALSIYDAAVIFRLSSGLLALLQAIAAVVCIVYILMLKLGKKAITGAFLPCTLGVLCILLGTAAMFLLIFSRSAGIGLTVVLTLTRLVVPILFGLEVKKFDICLKNREAAA